MARWPVEYSRALESQFGFDVADGHFDLPAAGISQDNLPSELCGMGGLAGEQVPRGLSLASCHHQPKGLAMSGVCDWERNDAGLTLTAPMGIP